MTMLNSAEKIVERPLYSSGTYPQRTGFFGLPLRVSMFGGLAMVVCLITMMTAGLVPAVVMLSICALVLTPMVITVGRRTVYEAIQLRIQWWRRRASGTTVYRGGPHSRLPGGRYRLPGILATTTLHQGIDRLGNPFGMVHRRRGDQYTVVLECWPGGDEALTQQERDLMTADWGAYLAGLGLPGDIAAAVVVVETIPATGLRLRREVGQMITNSRSEIASQVMVESALTFPAGKQQQLARLSITFQATTRERRTDPEEMATELARRLPSLYEDLLNAGVEATPMPAAQIVEFVHRSYNPSSEADFEELDILGENHGLDWEDAGPAAAAARWDHYRHDAVTSVVWEMQSPPESVFPDTVLKPLLAPHDALERKRVTIFYRPYTAGDATRKVDKEYKDALVSLSQGKGVKSAASELRVQATEQQRVEQVRGAGLLRYSVLITVTCQDDIPTAAAITESLSARARLKLRRTYGQMDAAYAASLGVGVLLPDHSSMTRVAGTA
ncbi:SCO6880 family protein [Nocardia asiatica]|uniref:SCO6880 family protein n=1 Tax=Nocardia asiatica TaxID=209252 RepID=UPI0002DFF820|nr:SCO6880 family protein [Nocardia asiatica]